MNQGDTWEREEKIKISIFSKLEYLPNISEVSTYMIAFNGVAR